MIWEDKGFLIYKNRYNENSVIAEFFTENRGKISGVIYGATSKKIRNYLQIGNKFHINFQSKNNNKLGYFKLEIDEITTPYYLDDKLKLYAIIYIFNLIKILTVENQENRNIFNIVKLFFKALQQDRWIKSLILLELEIYKAVGYDINFQNYVTKENVNGDKKYFTNTILEKRIIPEFLIDKKEDPKTKEEILLGINLVGDFLDKTILKPNNINYPAERYDFVNLLKD
tara:strand:+ start:156 stop:839 length:684 start_codon:yes stop_codon:yes gene_type:complete